MNVLLGKLIAKLHYQMWNFCNGLVYNHFHENDCQQLLDIYVFRLRTQ